MRGDPTDLANVICTILHTIYVEKREQFEQHARHQGTSVEALAASAICALIQEPAVQGSGRAGVGPHRS